MLIKLRDDSIPVPKYQHVHDAGFDLTAQFSGGESWIINPGQILKVPTGLYMAIPEGFEGQVRPRSGLAIKQGITVVNSPGTIDASYRGEVVVGLINLSKRNFKITNGDRIAQMVITPVARMGFKLTDSLVETERGEGGLGSTGV